MKTSAPCLALLLALAGCGNRPDTEQSPGAAERYLDNVIANEVPADRTAATKGRDERSPSAGSPAPELGQAPVFSREAVAPRR
jgi:hypothetical protein